MSFNDFALPTLKRRSANSGLKPFPVDTIPEKSDEHQFVGIFNGLSVEIIDPETINRIYSNGCFGLSTMTKSTPQALNNFQRGKHINQSLYQQKLSWCSKFTNQNPNRIILNLLPQAEAINVSKADNKDGNNDMEMFGGGDQTIENSGEVDRTIEQGGPEVMDVVDDKREPQLNLLADPFPIEDVLALLPEEAFFLHFSLQCLKVVDFEQTHEFTTEELFEKFCILNSKFIERYVVYHYYRSKNWVVKSGLKFGGDFLLYYKGPSYYHASYVVLVNDYDDKMNHLDMQSNYRVADSTNKEIILANVMRPNNLEYSNWKDCLKRINEFQITEILPKRFLLNQLNAMQSKS